MRTSNVVIKGDPRVPQTPDGLYAQAQKGSNDLNAFYKETKAREDADKRALKEFNKRNRDVERGIQNPQSQVRGGYAESISPEILDKTIGEQFIAKESVAGRAYNRNKKRRGDSLDGDDNTSEGDTNRSRFRNLANAARIQNALRQKLLSKGGASVALRKRLAQSTFWWSLVIVGTAGMFQTLFAFITWIGYGIHFYAADSVVGKAVSWIMDVEKYSPAIYMGHIGFGMCIIIAIAVFFVFLGWFTLILKAPVLGGPAATFTTISCFFFSIVPIPIINLALIPWVVYWTLYMNTKGLFSN